MFEGQWAALLVPLQVTGVFAISGSGLWKISPLDGVSIRHCRRLLVKRPTQPRTVTLVFAVENAHLQFVGHKIAVFVQQIFEVEGGVRPEQFRIDYKPAKFCV